MAGDAFDGAVTIADWLGVGGIFLGGVILGLILIGILNYVLPRAGGYHDRR